LLHTGLNVVMLGPPGAGKGTQAQRLARAYGVPKISTGDILREAAAQETTLGAHARSRIDQGHLVSDEVAIEIVRERLARQDVAKGFILDGFPRTVAQAEALDRMMTDRGALIVLHMVVPAEVLIGRLNSRRICSVCGANADPTAPEATRCGGCGGELVQRVDDDEQVVRNRLAVYEQQTRPLVAFYAARPTLFEIDANQAPDRVAEDMMAAITTTMAAGQGEGR
jgi:adenylate kinase